MPQDRGPYSAAWRRYRRWSRLFWIVFVFYLPALAFVGLALGWKRDDGVAIFDGTIHSLAVACIAG